MYMSSDNMGQCFAKYLMSRGWNKLYIYLKDTLETACNQNIIHYIVMVTFLKNGETSVQGKTGRITWLSTFKLAWLRAPSISVSVPRTFKHCESKSTWKRFESRGCCFFWVRMPGGSTGEFLWPLRVELNHVSTSTPFAGRLCLFIHTFYCLCLYTELRHMINFMFTFSELHSSSQCVGYNCK